MIRHLLPPRPLSWPTNVITQDTASYCTGQQLVARLGPVKIPYSIPDVGTYAGIEPGKLGPMGCGSGKLYIQSNPARAAAAAAADGAAGQERNEDEGFPAVAIPAAAHRRSGCPAGHFGGELTSRGVNSVAMRAT